MVFSQIKKIIIRPWIPITHMKFQMSKMSYQWYLISVWALFWPHTIIFKMKVTLEHCMQCQFISLLYKIFKTPKPSSKDFTVQCNRLFEKKARNYYTRQELYINLQKYFLSLDVCLFKKRFVWTFFNKLPII